MEVRDLLAAAILVGGGYYAYTKLAKKPSGNTGIVPGGFVSNAPGNTPVAICSIPDANLRVIAQIWTSRLAKDKTYDTLKQTLAQVPLACRKALGEHMKALGASWTWVDTALIPGVLPGS